MGRHATWLPGRSSETNRISLHHRHRLKITVGALLCAFCCMALMPWASLGYSKNTHKEQQQHHHHQQQQQQQQLDAQENIQTEPSSALSVGRTGLPAAPAAPPPAPPAPAPPAPPAVAAAAVAPPAPALAAIIEKKQITSSSLVHKADKDSRPVLSFEDAERKSGKPKETDSIKPNGKGFLQHGDFFSPDAKGISLEALGEPKSGTTWLGRLVTRMALELCDSYNNKWCEMGGLAVHDHKPGPWYEFEMLNRTTTSPRGNNGQDRHESEVFIHFKGYRKHIVAGMDAMEAETDCRLDVVHHEDEFVESPPCRLAPNENQTRQSLDACVSERLRCLPDRLRFDPARRRSFTIFREPRDVISSEYKMRVEVYKQEWTVDLSLEEFIRKQFVTLVSWMHHRWAWQTSDVMAPASHIVYYEEYQESHLGLIDMANFMGLECSPEQALKVWQAHRQPPHGNYATHPGLHAETIKWMTATMARLLPPPLALRWGVTPTDLPSP